MPFHRFEYSELHKAPLSPYRELSPNMTVVSKAGIHLHLAHCIAKCQKDAQMLTGPSNRLVNLPIDRRGNAVTETLVETIYASKRLEFTKVIKRLSSFFFALFLPTFLSPLLSVQQS